MLQPGRSDGEPGAAGPVEIVCLAAECDRERVKVSFKVFTGRELDLRTWGSSKISFEVSGWAGRIALVRDILRVH